MRLLLIGFFALLTLGPAVAQNLPTVQRIEVPHQIQQPTSEAPIHVAGDPVKTLQKRVIVLGKHVRVLQGRVTSLEESLREMRANTEYSCTAPAVSTNGAGVTENCTPLACNYIDGRCRQSAAGTQHCAPGYIWDGSGRCTTLPPSNDEDCGFLGLGCM